MSDLAGRIAARLDALEAGARAATGGDRTGNWWLDPDEGGVTEVSCLDVQGFITAVDVDAAFIAAWDPAAVLRLVDGLRAVVDRCGSVPTSWDAKTLLGIAAALGVENTTTATDHAAATTQGRIAELERDLAATRLALAAVRDVRAKAREDEG